MWDADAGLYWYHARWYDPHTGRFISQDPSGFAPGDFNLYRYVGNSPTLFVDSRGLREVRLVDDVGVDAPLNISSWDSDVVPTMEETGGMAGTVGTGGDVSYIFHHKTPNDSVYDAFLGSIHKSFDSIALGWQGAYQQAIGDPRANATYEEAVKNSPQQQATGGFRTAVEVSLAVAVEAMKLATRMMMAELASHIVSSIFSPPTDSLCGDGDIPGCFIAGTPVLVPGLDQNPVMAQGTYSTGENSAESISSFAAIGVAVGLVVCDDQLMLRSRLLRRQRRRGRRTDDIFGDDSDSNLADDEGFANDEIKTRRSDFRSTDADVRDRIVFEFSTAAQVRTQVPAQRTEHALLPIGATVGGSAESIGALRAAVGGRTLEIPNLERRRATSAPQSARTAKAQQSMQSPSRRTWRSLRVALGVLLTAGCLARALWSSAGHTAPAVPRAQAVTAASHSTRVAIESLRVGQRVLTDGNLAAIHGTAVDEATWRHLRLQATLPWADGTQDLIEVETLQPPEWIAAHGAEIGARVPMPLDLTEMGIPTDLPTRVVANERCPRLQTGPGRILTSTVNHLHPQVIEHSLRNYDGRQETVRPTAPHKFYSESRGTWVSAVDLRRGERLRGVGGSVTVTGMAPVPGVHRVYNMSVETEHVYRVSHLGVLVHNPDCYYPTDANGDPVPLPQQQAPLAGGGTTDVPTPDPAAGGAPHTTLGGRIGSDGVPYGQSATFPGETWPKANGQDVPWSRVDWTDHGRPWDHPDPHQHIFYWDIVLKQWMPGPQVPFVQ